MRFSLLGTGLGVASLLVVSLSGVSHARGCNMHPAGGGYGAMPYMAGPYGHGPMQRPMQRPMMRPYGGPMRAYPPGYGNPAPAMAPAATAAATPAAPAAAPTVAVESAQVTIAQMRFSQPTVTIKKGGTVTWQNTEAMPHTVTANDGSFSSQQLQNGAVFTKTFDEPGTYSYYCSLHPMMRGTVVVEG